MTAQLPSPEELPNTDVVIYDGDCGICTAQVSKAAVVGLPAEAFVLVAARSRGCRALARSDARTDDARDVHRRHPRQPTLGPRSGALSHVSPSPAVVGDADAVFPRQYDSLAPALPLDCAQSVPAESVGWA